MPEAAKSSGSALSDAGCLAAFCSTSSASAGYDSSARRVGVEELNKVRSEGCEREGFDRGIDVLGPDREREFVRAAVLETMRHRIEIGHLRRGVNIMRESTQTGSRVVGASTKSNVVYWVEIYH